MAIDVMIKRRVEQGRQAKELVPALNISIELSPVICRKKCKNSTKMIKRVFNVSL